MRKEYLISYTIHDVCEMKANSWIRRSITVLSAEIRKTSILEFLMKVTCVRFIRNSKSETRGGRSQGKNLTETLHSVTELIAQCTGLHAKKQVPTPCQSDMPLCDRPYSFLVYLAEDTAVSLHRRDVPSGTPLAPLRSMGMHW